MSVNVEFIERISEGLGISTTKEALRSLSVDVEYKIRDIIQVCFEIIRFHSLCEQRKSRINPSSYCFQYASKIARNSKRSTINANDINNAFYNLNIEVRITNE